MEKTKRNEFLHNAAKSLHMSPATLKPILNGIVQEIRDQLIAGNTVGIVNFGAFTPKIRHLKSPIQPGMGPGVTGPVQTYLGAYVSFKAAKILKEMMKEGKGE